MNDNLKEKSDVKFLAKVTAIIDLKTLIINKGFSNSDLAEGDILEIFEPGPDIYDVDTGDSLGRYDYIKSTLRVEEVNEKYSICRKRIKESGGLSNAMSPLLSTTYSYSDLNIDKSADLIISELKNPKIIVGDLVDYQ